MSSEHESWKEEEQSAYLYEVVSASETDILKKKLFHNLAKAARIQSDIWLKAIREKGGALPKYRPSLRVGLVAWCVRRLGPYKMRRLLAAMKVRGLSVYLDSSFVGGHVMPTTVEEVGLRHRKWSAGNLRAAVFGVNDGLVSNASLMMGLAGAGSETPTLILAGLAGGLAGAFSMAAGEYVSVRSQREMYDYQIRLEEEELKQYPEEEARELALIYEARGLSASEADVFARKMLADPVVGLKTLAREELGIDPDAVASPWGAAIFSFFSFSGGAVIPVMPFLLGLDHYALETCMAATGLSLFVVGAMVSLWTGRNALWSGLRMVLIGGGAGVATYALGFLSSLSR